MCLGPAHGKDTKVYRVPGEAHDKYLTTVDVYHDVISLSCVCMELTAKN